MPFTAVAAQTLFADGFSESTTPANAFAFSGDACLTAGTAATPATSLPACGTGAPVDAVGQGALQLTQSAPSRVGMAVETTALSTANGLSITFTDSAFNGTSQGADGLSLFLIDASKGVPSGPGADGGSLGYANNANTSGIAGGYLGIGFDEFGGFSTASESRTGGPGYVAETIAVRGAAAINYAYLTGYVNAGGTASSLPFKWDQPTLAARPANAPTITVTLMPTGTLTVAVDRHDGNGSTIYLNKKVTGINGQPAVPANVYVGFAAGTGANYLRHQIRSFSIGTPAPQTSFAPSQVANLSAWFDGSSASYLTQNAGLITSWLDRSGNGNAVSQGNAALQPSFTTSGINGFPSVSFGGAQFLTGTNTAFSNGLFNASTVFVVANQADKQQASSLVWAGPYYDNPRWTLRLTEAGVSHFDFNNSSDGRLSVADQPLGPSLWTAAGSVAAATQYLRKNGNTIGSDAGPASAVSGQYALNLGAMNNGGGSDYFYNGQLGEVLVYGRLLTNTEQAQVEGYLACKWSLQSRLPANHPYRTICPQGGAVAVAPVPGATATPAPNAIAVVPELRSSNGVLNVTVTATANASTGYPQYTYNGSAVPPTLRVLPGDTLNVTLVNSLPVPPAGSAYLNDTNMHFHGLHVSPNAPADDSIDLIAMPGQTLTYQVPIPANHPTGLYWYHSHAHGEAERQNLAGMSGALIVDGIVATTPSVANMPERVLVVRDTQPAGTALPNAVRSQVAAMNWAMAHTTKRMSMAHMSMDAPVRGRTNALTRNPYVLTDRHYRRFDKRFAAASTHCTGAETAVHNWTINGQTQPSIGIRPGEQQFWRLVNAGSDTYLDVQVDNTSMQLIALDGVPISQGTGTPSSLTVTHYVVPPASRIEFIVTGPGKGTTAYLRTNCFDAGSAGPAMPAAILATIDSAHSLPDALRRAQRTLKKKQIVHRISAAKLRMATVAATQTVYYSDQNTINGSAYDPAAPPAFYAQSGTVQEWTVVNNSSQVHTFHIHQIHMLLEAVNGVSQSQEFLLDNINVPAATSAGPGSIKVLLDFTDPLVVGTFLLHCHILSHEDAGMMAKIRVGTAPPMTASSTSVTFASPAAAAQNVTISGGKTPYSVTGCSGVANAALTGTTLNLTPVAAGSCFVTVADSSGLVVSVTVTVTAPPAALTVSPNALSFTSPTASAQNATIAGGTTPYATTGCGGVATASVSGTTLSVAPSAAGSCSLTVSDSASHSATVSITVNAPATGSAADNVTFHQNAARQGWYAAETALTTTNVAGTGFGLLGTLAAPAGSTAFGKVYGQPLYVTDQGTSDGKTHNLVIVSTATDQIYAFDDATDAVVWHRDFTNAGAGITQQLASDTGCSDVNPNVGITGTPVIDRAKNMLYVVVPTKENGVFHQRLHAISLANGADAIAAVEIAASVTLPGGTTAALNPEWNFNRAALLEANGNIYVAMGSHCDYNVTVTHGWVFAYSASTLALTGNALDITGNDTAGHYFLGSPWMSGFGPAADAQGNIYFATGNGPYDGTLNFSMAVVKAPGTLDLSKATTFSPFGEAADSSADDDLGAGGVVLLPDLAGATPHLVFAGGKCGAGSANGGTQGCVKYLLNRDALGGKQSGDAGSVWHLDVGGGLWGGPAYFGDASGNSYLVFGTGNPIATYRIGTNPVALSVQSTVNAGCLDCRNSGSEPVVSSNGTTAGTAIVWALHTPGNAGGTISLTAFDALNMSHVLFKTNAGSWTVGSGFSVTGGAMVTPLVANGRVYVPVDGGVAYFGLH